MSSYKKTGVGVFLLLTTVQQSVQDGSSEPSDENSAPNLRSFVDGLAGSPL